MASVRPYEPIIKATATTEVDVYDHIADAECPKSETNNPRRGSCDNEYDNPRRGSYDNPYLEIIPPRRGSYDNAYLEIIP